MSTKFRKKPVVFEAIQWSGNVDKSKVDAFVGKELRMELESETAYVAGMGKPFFSLIIPTAEGDMKAMPNDWIIKEPFPTNDREFYPCKPDIFEKTYEPVDTQRDLERTKINHTDPATFPSETSLLLTTSKVWVIGDWYRGIWRVEGRTYWEMDRDKMGEKLKSKLAKEDIIYWMSLPKTNLL